MKLQKYPQFRPLLNRALGLQAAEKNLTAGIGLVTGKYTGSVEKWLETTVKDMMKVHRWEAYADVLGAKSSTLLEPTPTTYSNSRWGQFAKAEDPRALEAAPRVLRRNSRAREPRFGFPQLKLRRAFSVLCSIWVSVRSTRISSRAFLLSRACGLAGNWSKKAF
ncbi:hypothetical protein [Ralstonia solanacearum]|uniref:hypothetical protein n=1 Tax=Ralstonia solanacearum TaxID=305 RepID=UPI0002D6AE1B|nr:hypothetical protein [Ralstonia solanacearum]